MITLLVRSGAGQQAALLSTWPASWLSGLTTTTPSEAADSRGYAGSPGAEAPQGSHLTPDHKPGGGSDNGGPLRQLWAHISRQQGGERRGSRWQTVPGACGQKLGLLLQVLPATQRSVATRGAIMGARKQKRGNRCRHPQGCDTSPCFGYAGERPRYCKAHALQGMEDVKNKRCEHAGCRSQPGYGRPGGRPQYCKVHAPEGMEDVRNKRCEHVGCKIHPCYGYPGRRPQHCKAHALEGMENVLHKRCEHAGCHKIAWHGYPGQRSLYCKVHALEGMEDVNPRRGA